MERQEKGWNIATWKQIQSTKTPEKILWKWDQKISTGNVRQSQEKNTIFFITKYKIPTNRLQDVTYGRIVHDYREGKAEPNRTWLNVGRDKINYPRDCSTPTSNLLTKQQHLNTQGKVYAHRHKKLLPEYPTQEIQKPLAKASRHPRVSNTNMNYKTRWQVRCGYMSKLEKACMAYRKQGYWHKSSWKKGSPEMSTHRANLPPDCEHITQDP